MTSDLPPDSFQNDVVIKVSFRSSRVSNIMAVEKRKRGRPPVCSKEELAYVFKPAKTLKEVKGTAAIRSVERVIKLKGKTLQDALGYDYNEEENNYSMADYRWDRDHGYLKDTPNAPDTSVDKKQADAKRAASKDTIARPEKVVVAVCDVNVHTSHIVCSMLLQKAAVVVDTEKIKELQANSEKVSLST